jgi:hypothetical protein
MGKLKQRFTFKRWAPDIGENRDLEEPAIWFELATGLSADQLKTVREVLGTPLEQRDVPEGLDGAALEAAAEASLQATKDGVRRRLVEAIGQYVRIVGGPHSIDGAPFATLDEYLCIVQQQADCGLLAVSDLTAAVFTFNSFSGADELFSPRRSGSSASTAPRSVVKETPKTGGA